MSVKTNHSSYGYGFAGCPVVDAETGLFGSAPDTVCLIGVDTELNRKFGSPNSGAAAYIRRQTANLQHGTLSAKLSDLAVRCGAVDTLTDREVLDVGLITEITHPLQHALFELGESCGRLERRVGLVACDHTASFWFAAGLSKTCRFHYVYLDAHLDLGWHHSPDRLASQQPNNGTFVSHLIDARIVDGVTNIGARAAATFHECYAGGPVQIVRSPWVSDGSFDVDLRHLIGQDIYLSIDVDVIDPCFAPNATCPEPFGPSALDVIRLILWLATHCNILAADLSEIVPEQAFASTAQTGIYALLAALTCRSGLRLAR
jgi:arginase family enzyme